MFRSSLKYSLFFGGNSSWLQNPSLRGYTLRNTSTMFRICYIAFAISRF